jgi:hypothetical protein
MDEIKTEKTEIEKMKEELYRLQQKINDYYKEETKREIEANQSYVGRTLKKEHGKQTQYYKILAPHESNQFRFYTFVFMLPFTFESIQMLDVSEIIDLDHVGFLCTARNGGIELDSYTEISTE